MDDQTFICPFDMSHQISKRRIQYHLIKCQKSHPDVHVDVCPFNASHRMQKSELCDHIGICPSRPAEVDDTGFEKIFSMSKAKERERENGLRDEDAKTVEENHENKSSISQKKMIPRIPKTCPRALSVCGLSIRVQNPD
ncbi:hypothetical protein R5R35_001051 [Gryllus longicercus]|uniref:CHHC U11-48K-type domain-containing protein n=1 Tax=Gryllus longicercus TaxID=2509291 RepID=A0AAN9YUW5_9ORTH